MKIVKLLFLSLLVLGFACNNTASESDSTNQGEEDKMEEPAAEEAPAHGEMVEGEGYTIKTIEGGIASPRKEMVATIGDATVTINYGSPSVKGRTIWGGLEPYDEVWRTGANKATSIKVSQDVNINGEKLAAGTYGLFTIPGKDKWTVIFNKNHDQWGDYDYNAKEDVLRVEVDPMTLPETKEAMDFVLEDGKTVVLKWDKVAVPFEVAAI